MTTKQATKQVEALETLRKAIKPGETVYTVLRHVSASGMMRVIDVYIIKNDTPLRYSWSVADAIGAKYNRKHEGVEVHGCGMDMGFHVVDSLSHALFWKKGETYEDYKKGGTLYQRWI